MFPTLFHWGRFYIATYGVLVAAGYLISILWLKSQLEPSRMTEDRFWGMIYALFFGALAGGKLLFILLNWELFSSGQMQLLRDIRFGFVYFGGFLGALILGLVYFRRQLSEFRMLSDYFGTILPVGHAIGRLGCVAAGCCFGRPTTMPWAIRFTDPRSLVAPHLLGLPLHPTQLYEAAGNLLIAGLMFRLLRKVQDGEYKTGSVMCAYVLLYASMRFFVEFFRGDDRGGFLWGLSPSQWISLGTALAALTAAWRGRLWLKKSA